jgi:hypothetical protein
MQFPIPFLSLHAKLAAEDEDRCQPSGAVLELSMQCRELKEVESHLQDVTQQYLGNGQAL